MAGSVYVSVTNECNADVTMLASRGPSFAWPPGTHFELLSREPTGKQVADAVLAACRDLDVSEGKELADGRAVVFAGLGEPLVGLTRLLDSLHHLKGRAEVASTRLNTNGLVAVSLLLALLFLLTLLTLLTLLILLGLHGALDRE
jgi:MoaA/NifB/PqqE/SkfB family radical SAM enzyme